MKNVSNRMMALAFASVFMFSAIVLGIYFGVQDSSATDEPHSSMLTHDTRFKMVSVGPGHTLAITEDGELWGWGNGFLGN